MMETTMDNTMMVTPTKKAKEDSAVAPASSMANTPASVATSNYSDAAIEGNDHGEDDEGSSDDLAREQDRLLPIANVARIMKQAVPGTAKVAKDAKECVQECVSEFISFVTSEACERCQQEKRKTINGEDIIYAMEALGFEQYAHIMKLYLQKYKEVTKHDKPYGMVGSMDGVYPGDLGGGAGIAGQAAANDASNQLFNATLDM